ncbi:MAG TPA: hypothetical protein VFV41_21070 [Streptosporangiaceae bacterium]|nr:hypothetical protein [Streptosporangiaceae bacterium]
MLALFAAHQAAAGASGLAGGLVPAISASTLDGFAVGMLLSGGVFLLITAHAQGSRRFGRTVAPRPVSELAGEPGGPPAGQELGDYPLPAPVAVAPPAAVPAAAVPAAVSAVTAPPPAAPAATLTLASTSAADHQLLVSGRPDEIPALAAPDEESGSDAERSTRRAGGYQSRHRMSEAEESRPWPAPDGRRHAPRHAAPASSGLARRMSALKPIRMVAPSHRAI